MENTNNTPVIEPLYSGDGRQLYPITHIKALIDGDGKLLKEELDGIHSDITDINNKLSEGIGVSIVDSVDDLPSDAPLGLMASVLEVTTEEKSLAVGHESLSGERVVRVEINNTVYLSITNNFEFILTTKDGSSVEILSKGSGPDTQLYFIGLDGSEMALADYSQQYNTAELNSANIELLNELLLSDKYYSKDNYTNSEQSAISAFFKGITVEKEVTTTKVYVKNTAGWEEYDKATKDKVATLEAKVAELEAKIQELLQN